jgi:hypothetical protein
MSLDGIGGAKVSQAQCCHIVYRLRLHSECHLMWLAVAKKALYRVETQVARPRD